MKEYGIIFGLMLSIFIILAVKHAFSMKGKVLIENRTKFMVRVGIFGAMSAILYCVPFLKFPLPIFPSFLEFHFDEIPAFIAAFAYGPFSGLCVLLVKTIIKLPMTNTLAIGEIADLLYSLAFILPAALYYKNHRQFKGALIGILIGLIIQLTVSLVLNVYIMFPFYMKLYGMDEIQLLRIFQLTNPSITDVRWSVGFIAVVPFNAIKDAAVIIVTLMVYKSLHRVIDKIAR